MQKYRYNKMAGVLNEAAQAPVNVASAANRRPGLSVGSASMHAQTRMAPPPPPPMQMPGPAAQTPDWSETTSPGTVPVPEFLSTPDGGAIAVRGRRRVSTAVPGGLDPTSSRSYGGMFYYTVDDGQRALSVRRDGTMEVIVGPRRVFRWGRRFERMSHYVAHPGEFLIVRFRDGRQEHVQGPADIWFDPRSHIEISKEDALQISAKEAVVVYSQGEDGKLSRRVVHGPEVFVPRPGEWLHTFSWHGAKGGHEGYQKVPNGLVFQKLWLMPDQMYHDVPDVRTADDAVLTIRLMIFFELVDIETMLNTTHDPIGDFVNAATSDVVDFTGRHDFDSFKRNTEKLNDLGAYPQLLSRAAQCGYRVSKIVYRGYGAPESLQRMHDEAIESRTRLQLQRATEQQAQELEDFKQERQMSRAQRQRADAAAQASHGIEIERQRQEASLQMEELQRTFARQQGERDAASERARTAALQAQARAHLEGLRALGVDLTRLLTQGRADQVIELRGAAAGAQLHLPGPAAEREP